MRSLVSFRSPTAGRWTAIRVGVAGLAAAGLLAGAVGAGGAQDDHGLVDGSSYESPTYGYEVEWADHWESDSAYTASTDGADTLSLSTFGAFALVVGLPTDLPVEDLAPDWAEGYADGLLDDPELVEQGETAGASYAIVEGDYDGRPQIVYVEAREIVAAEDGELPIVVVTTFSSTESTYAKNVASAAADIELDGDPLLTTYDGDESDDRERDADERDRDDERDTGRNQDDRADRNADAGGRDDEDGRDTDDEDDEDDEDDDE